MKEYYIKTKYCGFRNIQYIYYNKKDWKDMIKILSRYNNEKILEKGVRRVSKRK